MGTPRCPWVVGRAAYSLRSFLRSLVGGGLNIVIRCTKRTREVTKTVTTENETKKFCEQKKLLSRKFVHMTPGLSRRPEGRDLPDLGMLYDCGPPRARDHDSANGPPHWFPEPLWPLAAASLRRCVMAASLGELPYQNEGAGSARLSRRRTEPAGERWTGTSLARFPLAAGTRKSRGPRVAGLQARS